jgi:hypothetical protein
MDVTRMNPNGQIDIHSEFGQLLYAYAEHPNVQTILEVGTWKGNGTTTCVVEGLRKKLEKTPGEPVHFYSLESNLPFLMEAMGLWIPKAVPFLHLLYGRLHSDGLMTKEQIEADPKFSDVKTHYDLWYTQDVIDYNKAPLIDSKYLPNQLHMIVLDGGEFSGYADWDILRKKNPIVVALDDTNVMKNARVLKELSEDSLWEKRHASNERNGWAIFVRK